MDSETGTETGDDRGDRGSLVAALRPGGATDGGDPDVVITAYVVTGRHGGLRIPESFCRECDLFVRAADRAAAAVDADVEVRVVSWWTNVLSALRHGGYHPPVMVVGGRRLCQGHHVPAVEEVTAAIEAALEDGATRTV